MKSLLVQLYPRVVTQMCHFTLLVRLKTADPLLDGPQRRGDGAPLAAVFLLDVFLLVHFVGQDLRRLCIKTPLS